MYAGIELSKEYNGSSVSLQVRADNLPAKNLYTSLNFKEVAGTTYLHLSRVPMIEDIPKYALPDGVSLRVRKPKAADTRQAYNLASIALPAAVQKEWPLRQSHFQISDKERLTNFLRGLFGSIPSAYWVVEDGSRFVGLLNVRPSGFGRAHQIELIVHPDWRGYLERPLISKALIHLSLWRNKRVLVKHPADHSEAIDTYKEFGFYEDQTLIWMKLDL